MIVQTYYNTFIISFTSPILIRLTRSKLTFVTSKTQLEMRNNDDSFEHFGGKSDGYPVKTGFNPD